MRAIPLAQRMPAALRWPARAARADYSGEVRLLRDLLARAAIIVLFSTMAVRFAADFVEAGRVTGLFLLLSEALVVVLTFLRRSAIAIDGSLRARVLTTAATAGPLLLIPAGGAALAPDALTVALSCAGIAIVIAGKVTLGRSFALLPANRGVVSSGLYGVVRHPIYLGYFVTHFAFLLASPSAWNVAALALADAAQIARALCEEGTLAKDPAYRAYQSRVRWRVAPGLF